ncbi:MAG: hypothetical protein EH225_00645 [Calditrichaeota bacterium]|nr:hypothetical protein [Calditrichota bacterium]RQW08135.1 MAG: hypothetical protein EH225_00645 [Calditrichota bacterium]
MNLVSSLPFLSLPVLYAIENNLVEHHINIKYLHENDILSSLTEGSADAAFISPLTFARNTSGLQIVRDFTVNSPNYGRNALLFFSGNLTSIDTIYFESGKDNNEFDLFLAEVVLKEYFEIIPQWEKIENVIPDSKALASHKVIFIPSPISFDMYPDYENYIDLSEEWSLQTELPLVHGLLCVTNSFKDRESLAKLRLSRELGLRNLMKIAKRYAENHPQNWDVYFDLWNEKYQYYPVPETWDSLEQLFSYMFYYARAEYYPELKFYPED